MMVVPSNIGYLGGLGIINSLVVDSPLPSNVTYFRGFGSILGLALLIQIITGIFLAMHYVPDMALSFISVEHVMRDTVNGWILRYAYVNGVGMFFIVVYINIARGLYYGSYRAPRVMLWPLGVFTLLEMRGITFSLNLLKNKGIGIRDLLAVTAKGRGDWDDGGVKKKGYLERTLILLERILKRRREKYEKRGEELRGKIERGERPRGVKWWLKGILYIVGLGIGIIMVGKEWEITGIGIIGLIKQGIMVEMYKGWNEEEIEIIREKVWYTVWSFTSLTILVIWRIIYILHWKGLMRKLLREIKRKKNKGIKDEKTYKEEKEKIETYRKNRLRMFPPLEQEDMVEWSRGLMGWVRCIWGVIIMIILRYVFYRWDWEGKGWVIVMILGLILILILIARIVAETMSIINMLKVLKESWEDKIRGVILRVSCGIWGISRIWKNMRTNVEKEIEEFEEKRMRSLWCNIVDEGENGPDSGRISRSISEASRSLRRWSSSSSESGDLTRRIPLEIRNLQMEEARIASRAIMEQNRRSYEGVSGHRRSESGPILGRGRNTERINWDNHMRRESMPLDLRSDIRRGVDLEDLIVREMNRNVIREIRKIERGTNTKKEVDIKESEMVKMLKRELEGKEGMVCIKGKDGKIESGYRVEGENIIKMKEKEIREMNGELSMGEIIRRTMGDISNYITINDRTGIGIKVMEIGVKIWEWMGTGGGG